MKSDKLITENIAKKLKLKPLEVQKFYTRPKIHKTGNRESPVVSSVKSHNNTISNYVDFHLQPSEIFLHMYETPQIFFKN